MAAADLSADRARELLSYDADTGIITRRTSENNSVRIGDVAGSRHPKGYIYVVVAGARHRAHRLAWLISYGCWPTAHIDHINGDPSDNRLVNLREVDNRLNAQNKRHPRAGNTSGLLGVSWQSKAQKWRAQICVDKKVIYLGLFADKHEAHAEYVKAKRQLHSGCTL